MARKPKGNQGTGSLSYIIVNNKHMNEIIIHAKNQWQS